MKKASSLSRRIIKAAKKNRWSRALIALAAVVAAWNLLMWVSTLCFPVPEKLTSGYSQVYLAKNGELLRLGLSKEGRYRIHLSPGEASRYVREGFLAYEDRYFFLHPGVNPVSMARAVRLNISKGKVVSGGSTITMQLARMLDHPGQKRSAGLKAEEILRALQLEWKYSKAELLEFYMNTAPMGGNIEGVGAASYLYFGKPASQLSAGQAALLVGLPKAPGLSRPDVSPGAAIRARNKVLARITGALGLSREELGSALAEKIPAKRKENPFRFPQLVLRVEGLGEGEVKTLAVDPGIQAFCEDLLRRDMKNLNRYKVYNAALIVVENKTSEVLAYVGSPDFKDKLHAGELNGANVRRSPGSLLKPFLYCRGVEAGLLTPKKIIFDAEIDFGGYTPANFSRKFSGQVKTIDSLTESLNVPAVNLEYELKEKGLMGFLKESGFRPDVAQDKYPGLSLVLGACPFTLEEMVRMYSCLANGGVDNELKFFSGGKEKISGRRVLSKEACYIVSKMLGEYERPDLPLSWEFASGKSRVAFKTGTSFGLRDAWCVGYTPDYTVGVWFGNMDCKGSGALVGIKTAAPALIEVFNKLGRFRDSWYSRPEGVKLRKVCTASGEPAGPFCSRTCDDLYIPGVSKTTLCSVHKEYFVKKNDGLEVCKYCMSGKTSEYEKKTAEVWPPDMAAYLRANGKKTDELPAHDPECRAVKKNAGLKIKNPGRNGVFVVSKALPLSEQKIALTADSSSGKENVSWYLDDKLVASGPADKTCFMEPVNGMHILRLIGSGSGFDSTKICVYEQDMGISRQ